MMLERAAFDWSDHMEADERLLWSGRPDASGLLIIAALFVPFAFIVGPQVLLFILLPVGLFVHFARDSYALTNRRILVHRRPLGASPYLESLPRAGAFAGPQMTGGPRAVWFTGPDRRRLSFRFVSRETQRVLIDSYPMGGPSLNPESAA